MGGGIDEAPGRAAWAGEKQTGALILEHGRPSSLLARSARVKPGTPARFFRDLPKGGGGGAVSASVAYHVLHCTYIDTSRATVFRAGPHESRAGAVAAFQHGQVARPTKDVESE